jgi:hypothetical protein
MPPTTPLHNEPLPPHLFNNEAWAGKKYKPFVKMDSSGEYDWVVPVEGEYTNDGEPWSKKDYEERHVDSLAKKYGKGRRGKAKKTAGRRKSKKAGRRTRRR